MRSGRLLLCCSAIIGMSGLVSCACVDRRIQPWVIGTEPGPEAAFARPRTIGQCVSISQDATHPENDFSAAISRRPNSCIASVIGYRSADCSGTEERGADIERVSRSEFFMGPIEGNRECEEALRVEKRSPCKLYEVYSGGVSYKFCYDYGVSPPRRVSASCCVNHTSPCN